MCFTIDQIDQACGILLLKEFNTFVYCCKKCLADFECGPNLEMHILSEHQDDKQNVLNDANFVDNCSLVVTPIESEPISVKTESFIDHVDELNYDVDGPLDELIEDNSFHKDNDSDESIKTEDELERINECDNRALGTDCNTIYSINKQSGESIVKKPLGRPPGSKNKKKPQEELIKKRIGRPTLGFFHCDESIKTEDERINECDNRALGTDCNTIYSINKQSGEPIVKKPLGRPLGSKNKKKPQENLLKKRIGRPTLGFFHCEMCPSQVFDGKMNLNKHMYDCHIPVKRRRRTVVKIRRNSDDVSFTLKSKTQSKDGSKKKPGRPTFGLFYCDMCPGQAFDGKMNLMKHMHDCHSAFKNRKQCEICQAHPRDYVTHMTMNHSNQIYKCDFCDATFKIKTGLDIHLRIHTGERPFLCVICGKSFRDKSTWRNHEQVHKTVKKFPCNQCDRSYTKPYKLRDHINAFHTKVRNYVCDECGKRFITQRYLRVHKMTHADKKLQCRYCDKKFKLWENRHTHEKLIHRLLKLGDGEKNAVKQQDKST